MIDEVKQDIEAVRKKLMSFAGRGPTYVSFDMDAIDPAYAPGTGTPVPGGLTSFEALSLLRALAGVTVVGLDIVEISPDHDSTGNTSLLAATLLAQMLASVAKGRAKATPDRAPEVR
jgi:arginase family enzyme